MQCIILDWVPDHNIFIKKMFRQVGKFEYGLFGCDNDIVVL